MPPEGAEILSPELCLVDPELAAQARLALEPAAEPAPRGWTKTLRLARRSLSGALALNAWLLLVHPQTLADSTTLGAPAKLSAAGRPAALHASPQARPPVAFTAGRRAARFRARGPDGAASAAAAAPSQKALAWPRVPNAAFYDVILWRRGERVLDLWPTTAQVALPEHWSFHGKRFTLADGPYLWFVYPASGTRSSARYGPLAAHGTVAKRPPS